MNVDQLLAMRKCELFTVEGKAPNVVMADRSAWQALDSVRSTDPIDAWHLKGMQHVFNSNGGVDFKAEFVRTPDDES